MRSALLSSLILSCLIGCASTAPPPWQIKVTRSLGGEHKAVCVAGDQVFIQSAFELRELSITPQHRLKITSHAELPQFKYLYPLTPQLQTPQQTTVTKRATLKSSDLTLKPESTLRDTTGCQTEAWLKLGARGRMSMAWGGRTLSVTRAQWRWGSDARVRLVRPHDLARVSLKPQQLSMRSKLKSKDRVTLKRARYLIATESGLWRWRAGDSSALSEPLPREIPRSLTRILRDGEAWWVHTRDLKPQAKPAPQGETLERYLAWPLDLKNGPARLISDPRNAPPLPDRMLAPLSGRALRGRRGGLSLKWGEHTLPIAPLRSLCVLNERLVAVATERDVQLWWGPQRVTSSTAPTQEPPRLFASLSLPAPTEQLLCERDALIMLGAYGLLYAELRPRDLP